MGICDLSSFYTFPELKKMTIESKDNLKIGHVIDIIFDSELKIHSFILGGSRWEEFKEALGIIEDVDPVVPIEHIKSIKDQTIYIDIIKDKLKHKLQEDALPSKSISYSSLKRKKIFDTIGNNFARIVNLIFLPCGDPIFVLGGSWFEELSEKLKFRENVDLLLPLDEIDSVNDKTITLLTPLDKLNLTLDDKPMDFESQRIYLNSLKAKGQVEMRLIKRQKVEEFRNFSKFR